MTSNPGQAVTDRAVNSPAAGGWTATGLRWRDGVPRLTAASGARVLEREVATGSRVGWTVVGPRRCVGIRTAHRHHPCPVAAELEPGGKAGQCGSCQDADQGLALARDQILDDGRTYRLYLAWFGPGLAKVGLTAEQRGTARLVEQAALAWTFVARGSLPGIRRAELTVAQSGLARERFTAKAKVGGWWRLPPPDERVAAVDALRAQVLRVLAGHAIELFPSEPVTDQVDLFGLTDGPPTAYREVTALAGGATLGGTLHPPIGRHLFLTPDQSGATPVLLDTRLLIGWALRPTPPGPCTGLTEQLRARPAEQAALF
ncbi:DUF2797 domain-containing protein [Kitasatospora sp. CMC57]|uniref:DUF2797 domain-containing protein n=1 Tax=Kitasatospora sp. CMC57 TaxID=3231513 RepID=A0AB33JQY1_9ACTN